MPQSTKRDQGQKRETTRDLRNAGTLRALRVDIPASLDRALEMTAAALDLPKRQLVADALEIHLDTLKPQLVAAAQEREVA